MITGPNDARHIIWATSMFFYIVLCFTNCFLLYIGSIYVSMAGRESGWAATAKTGPNDGRRVIWALGVFFFRFFEFFITYQLCLELFLYRTSPAHSSAPPSLETWVGGVFPSFLCRPCPCPLPHLKCEMEGLFSSSPYICLLPLSTTTTKNRQQGQKRAQTMRLTRRLGLMYMFFLLYKCFLLLTNLL